MKRYIFLLSLSLFLFSGVTMAGTSASQSDKGKKEQRDHRPGNSGRGNGNNSSHSNGKKDDKKNHGNGGMVAPGRPGGNSHPAPGTGSRPTPPPAPGFNPGHQHGYNPGHGPKPGHNYTKMQRQLAKMVKHASHGARDVMVWNVSPGVYVVKYWRGGHYWTQYLYPGVGRYGDRVRLVMDGPGRWYMGSDRRNCYHEENGGLRVYLNGTPGNPWTLIPSVELDIPF